MGRISSFITGAAVGVIAALMLAPRSGEETRTLVVEKAGAVASEAKDFGAGFPGSAQDAIKSVVGMGSAVAKDAPAKAKGAAGGVAAKPSSAENDELRQKIEAARKRIAAQVMENAEQSKAVDIAAEASEAVAEVVEQAQEEAAK